MKKVLISLMCIIMVVCFMPTVAMADGTTVTTVGNEGELRAAITSDNNVIQLTQNVTLTDTLEIAKPGESLTIDLNQNTLSGRVNLKGGTLTLRNGKVTGTQPLNVYGKETESNNYSVLNIESNVTVNTQGDDLNSVVIFPASGTTGYGAVANIAGTVYGTAFVSGNLGNDAGTYSDAMRDSNIINVLSGSTIYTTADQGIAMNGAAVVNIENGASVTGREAIGVKRGLLNVNGGTLTAVGGKVDPVAANNNGTEASGAAISVTSTYNYSGNIKVVVNGGTITSDNNNAFYVGRSKKDGNLIEFNENGYSIEVNGGTYDDISPIQYTSDNATIKLAQNVTLTDTLEIAKPGESLTIDLNQNTLSGRVNLKGGTLTLRNGKVTGTQPLNVYGKETESNNYSVLNIESNVTVNTQGDDLNSVVIFPASGTTGYGAVANIAGTVYGTAFVSGNLGNDAGTYSDAMRDSNIINVLSGSTIYTTADQGIAMNGAAVVNIENGASVTGREAIGVKRGLLNVNGGTLTAVGGKVDPVAANNNGTEASGAAISVTSTYNYSGNIKVVVNGGTITSDNNNAFYVGRSKKDGNLIEFNENGYSIEVKGGTFSSDPKEYVASGYEVTGAGPYIVSRIYVAPSTPVEKDPVTNSGTAGTDNATTSADLSGSTSTSNGTTSATVDKTTADKIVDKAVANKSEEIVIDATANSTTASNSTTTAQVTIPTDTLGAIAEKTEADVTIKTDVAEVKMDNAAAAAVSEQAEGDTVQIIAEKVKEDATEVHFELKVVCSDGKVISDFKGGNVAVTVALPKAMADKKVVCVYIDDNGHMSKVAGQKNADGTYTFNTGHFSSYAIMAEEEADAAIAAQKEAIKNIKIKLTSKQVKTKAGKKAVKITWTADAGDKVLDGVEVFRSTERYKGYGTEPFYTSTKGGNTGSYTNTKSLKKGNKYYYRVRGYVLVDGQKVYTDYSTKAWRTVK